MSDERPDLTIPEIDALQDTLTALAGRTPQLKERIVQICAQARAGVKLAAGVAKLLDKLQVPN